VLRPVGATSCYVLHIGVHETTEHLVVRLRITDQLPFIKITGQRRLPGAMAANEHKEIASVGASAVTTIIDFLGQKHTKMRLGRADWRASSAPYEFLAGLEGPHRGREGTWKGQEKKEWMEAGEEFAREKN